MPLIAESFCFQLIYEVGVFVLYHYRIPKNSRDDRLTYLSCTLGIDEKIQRAFSCIYSS